MTFVMQNSLHFRMILIYVIRRNLLTYVSKLRQNDVNKNSLISNNVYIEFLKLKK